MRPPAASPPTLARVCDRAAIAILAAVAVVAALTFRDYGLGWDDYTHSQMGDLLLALFGSGFRDQRALSFVNLYMYGGGFDVVAALLAKALPFGLFETRRLLGAAVGIAGLAVTWRLGRRVGGPLAGLFALLLLAACPLYYGHMFMNPKDAPFAVANALLLLALVRLIEDYPRPSPRSVMLFAVGLGFTVGMRILGVISALYLALPFALLWAHDWKAVGPRETAARMGRFVLATLPGLFVGYLVMGLVWPWGVLAPLNPLRAVEYFSHFFEKPWKELFEGTLVSVPDMPWTYLPTLFALKLPEVLLACGIGGIAIALARIASRKRPVRMRAALALIVGAALLPVAIALVTRPALYNGLRHFLFVVPPFAVLGGLAAAWVFEKAPRLGFFAAPAAAALFLFALASPIVEMVRLHPYQYTHFNRVAGGVEGAERLFMLDYWGLALKQAAQGLREKLAQTGQKPPPGGRWKIAVCGPHPPAAVALGPDFETTWDTHGADFALMLGAFYCRQPDAPVLADVEREGVLYARAYDLRNRTASNLLTMPPP